MASVALVLIPTLSPLRKALPIRRLEDRVVLVTGSSGGIDQGSRAIQELPGHQDVSTTMIYPHGLNWRDLGYAALQKYKPAYNN
jgi:integrase